MLAAGFFPLDFRIRDKIGYLKLKIIKDLPTNEIRRKDNRSELLQLVSKSYTKSVHQSNRFQSLGILQHAS